MLTFNSNYSSQLFVKAAKNTKNMINESVERLSTGKRINRAKDDTAGVAIATRLNKGIQGLVASSRKAADAQSFIDTMEGAIQETHKLLLRMRELVVQASNGTLSVSASDLDSQLDDEQQKGATTKMKSGKSRADQYQWHFESVTPPDESHPLPDWDLSSDDGDEC